MAAALKMTLDDREFKRYLRQVKKNVGDTRPVMVFAISVMQKSVVTRFRDGGEAPHKWPPLKPSTLAARAREGTSGSILIRTGELFQSFQLGGKHNFQRITTNSAEYGTKMIKARGLQFGIERTNLPARPMLFWSDSDVKAVMGFTWAYAYQPGIAKRFGTAPKVGTIPGNLFLGVG